jgi:hypothetical protein
MKKTGRSFTPERVRDRLELSGPAYIARSS